MVESGWAPFFVIRGCDNAEFKGSLITFADIRTNRKLYAERIFDICSP